MTDSWEERMAARAARRADAEHQREAAEAAREQAAYEARMAERQRAEFEAGPPGGCHECWSWSFGPWTGKYTWGHAYPAVQPGPPPPPRGLDWGMLPDGHPDTRDWCHHACHGGEPVFCGLIAMAAPGGTSSEPPLNPRFSGPLIVLLLAILVLILVL